MFRILSIGNNSTIKHIQSAIDTLNKAYSFNASVYYYETIEKYITNLSDINYDLLFIDVDSIDIKTLGRKTFIKSTEYYNHSVLITKQPICPIMYTLLKPIGYVNILSSKEIVDIVVNYISTEKMRYRLFEFNANKTKHIISKRQILFFQSDKNKISLYTQNNVYCFYGKLSDLTKTITFSDFLQVHKSYLINPYHIKSSTLHSVIVGRYSIPISRSRIHTIDRWLNEQDCGFINS